MPLFRSRDLSTVSPQGSIPGAPSSPMKSLYVKKFLGRNKLVLQGSDGIQEIVRSERYAVPTITVLPNATTTLTTSGAAITSVGTISHPAVTEDAGWMANFQTAASPNATCGTSHTVATLLAPTTGKSVGFNADWRLHFPDASYNSPGAGQGSRIFVGVSVGTFSTAVLADILTAYTLGFRRISTNALTETNWQFVARAAGTEIDIVDTGVPFVIGKTYDFYLSVGSGASTVYWAIRNVTDNTYAEGEYSGLYVMVPGFVHRAGFQMCTINATARNVRMARMLTSTQI